jgi:hypothetical protein
MNYQKNEEQFGGEESKAQQNYYSNYTKYKQRDEIIERMNENRRIMIVDDEPYNVLGLTIILQ